MRQGDQLTREDRLMEAAAELDFFASRYGWTLEELESQPRWVRTRLPVIAAVKSEIAEDRQREAGRAADRANGR